MSKQKRSNTIKFINGSSIKITKCKNKFRGTDFITDKVNWFLKPETNKKHKTINGKRSKKQYKGWNIPQITIAPIISLTVKDIKK